jgi:hypothetical protein
MWETVLQFHIKIGIYKMLTTFENLMSTCPFFLSFFFLAAL